MEKEKIIKGNEEISLKEKIKKTLFNRFYLELIAYLIIIMLGLFLSASIYISEYKSYDNFKIIAGFGITVLVFIMLYILGYLSARKRKGNNKYLACFRIYIVLFVIYILATLFYKENDNNFFIIDFLQRIKEIIITIHLFIFNWLNVLLEKEIAGEVYTLITPFIMFLGSRKNRKNEIKRIKRQKMMERREYNG